MKKKLMALIASTAVIIAPMLVNAGQARAAIDYPPAYITRDLFINPYYNGSADLPYGGAGRHIYLEGGSYFWSQDIIEDADGWDLIPTFRTGLALASGWYRWGCHISPRAGTYNPDTGYYFLDVCWLHLDGTPASATAYLENVGDWGLGDIGNYTWQSELYRQG